MVPALDGGPLIRVVIAGRRPDVRRALEIRLALEPDMTVVGSVSSVQATLPLLRALRPNVLLVDVDAGPETPAEAVTRARALLPRLRVVLLTYHRSAGLDMPGADEVVDKSPDAGTLLASVRRRQEGGPQGFV
jgi:DNA-binding NarL/FixJ family response regulator